MFCYPTWPSQCSCWLAMFLRYLMDEYLWGFTESADDVRASILWSYLIGLGFLLLGSEDVVMNIPTETPSNPRLGKVLNFMAGRFRTLILAVGVVNFWRAVWLLWDEYLGQTSPWSAGVSYRQSSHKQAQTEKNWF